MYSICWFPTCNAINVCTCKAWFRLTPAQPRSSQRRMITMATWSVFPHLGAYAFTATRLKQNWERLHAGDKERCPEDAEVLRAWMLFHRGEFEQATQVGLRCAGDGVTVAN